MLVLVNVKPKEPLRIRPLPTWFASVIVCCFWMNASIVCKCGTFSTSPVIFISNPLAKIVEAIPKVLVVKLAKFLSLVVDDLW